jgi:uncharacterized repeat protein (TIGR01451 family)
LSSGTYKAYVVNIDGCGAYSNEIDVALQGGTFAKPAVGHLSANPTGCLGGSVGLWITNSSAYGSSASYQWYENGSLIPGAVQPSYAATATATGIFTYTLQVQDGTCSAMSDAATVTINTSSTLTDTPAINGASSITSICGVYASVTLELTNEASFGPASSFTWFKDNVLIPGETSPTLVVTSTLGAGTYKAYVVNTSGCGAYSNEIDVTLQQGVPFTKPAVGHLSANPTGCLGGSVGLWITNSASYSSSVSYQWYENGLLIPGAVQPSYAATAAGTFTYTLQVQDGTCSAMSDAATVTIDAGSPLTATPVINGASSITAICGVDASVTLELTNAADFGPASSFTWFKDNVLIPGETSPTLVVTSASSLSVGTYKAYVVNASGCGDYSNPISATAATASTIAAATIASSGSVVCTSGSVTLYLTNISSFTAASFQWYHDGKAIPGATLPSYTTSAAGTYRVSVTENSHCESTSNEVPVAFSTSPAPAPVLIGGSIETICDVLHYPVLTVSNSSNNAVISYVWFRNASVIPGANSGTYEAREEGTYTVSVVEATCSALSDPKTVTTSLVPDVTPPTITRKNSGDPRVSMEPGLCYGLYDHNIIADEFDIVDDCPNQLTVTWSSVHPSGGSTPESGTATLSTHRYPQGATTLTIFVEDAGGNKTSATITVEVIDIEPPTLTLVSPATITVVCTGDIPSHDPFSSTASSFTVDDNCSTANITIKHLQDEEVVRTGANRYTIKRTWHAIDPDGTDDSAMPSNGKHSNIVTQYIIVNDDIPPTFDNDDEATTLIGQITCDNYVEKLKEINAKEPVFTDNCGSFTLAETQDPQPQSDGTLIIISTWVATDDSGNASTSTRTITLPNNDLGIEVNPSVNDAYFGDSLSYEVIVTNYGSCPVNAAVTSTVPAEFTYLSHAISGGSGNDSYDKTVWNVSLAPTASATLTVRAVFGTAGTSTGGVDISATVRNTDTELAANEDELANKETYPHPNDVTETIQGKGYAVTIEKWANDPFKDGSVVPDIGTVIPYTIRVENHSTEEATFLIRDSLPRGLEYVMTPPWTAIGDREIVTSVQLPAATHASGVAGVVEVPLFTRLTEEAGAWVTNYAEISRSYTTSSTTDDFNLVLCSATWTLQTTIPDLKITAVVTDANPEINAGYQYSAEDEYTFEVKYENLGEQPVKQATLTALFKPEQQRVVLAPTGVVAQGNGRVTWQLSDIERADGIRSVQMRVEPLRPGPATTTFLIKTDESESPKDNNADTVGVDQRIWSIPNVLTDTPPNDKLHIMQLDDEKYKVVRARLIVYNTWGNMVYRGTYKDKDTGFIISDDKKFTGANLSKGTYYYELIVEFEDEDGKRTTTVMKNWIMVLK